MQKDGNCLFRCVAFHTLGDEDQHDAIRTLLLRFERLNKTVFESRFIPADNQQRSTSFEQHLRHQLRSGTWGTQVELMAAATLFQVPIYCCYTSLCGSKYHWEAMNPIASIGNLRMPEIVKEDPAFYMQTPHHFELLYWENTHFDSIVSLHNNSLVTSFPELSGAEHFVDLAS